MRSPAQPLLTWHEGSFLRGGAPHRILSGSLHYFRVHPDLWRDRIARLASLGLNTVDTYVAWNFHERKRGHRSFDGWRDLEHFLALVREAGLDAIVRPGPYICAEWDNGALPAWLTGTPGVRSRSSEPIYLEAVRDWFDELLPRIAALQASQGGPVVAVQLENEFGSYGDDADYLSALQDMLHSGGITELIFTSDGPTPICLDGGSVPGVLAAANFGSRVDDAAQLMRQRRPGEPFFCAELWNGWFDHWGERHHVRAPEGAAATVAQLLAVGGSVNLYMAHGGTNFGLWAGANHDGTRLQPTQTSYDSDAPIAEDGTLTAKYERLREVFAKYAVQELPPETPQQPRLAPRLLPVSKGTELLASLRGVAGSVRAADPPTFEQLGIDAGMVLYAAGPSLPEGEVRLTIRGLRDRAHIFVDGTCVDVVDAVTAESGVLLSGPERTIRLEILVENQGRINFGPLLGEGKGILEGVWLDHRRVQRWSATAIPLEDWDEATLEAMCAAEERRSTPKLRTAGPERGWASAEFVVDDPGDAFLAFPGFGKGFAWVNGFLLGRYWEIGPQETYYLPAPLLRRGRNSITVLELERLGREIEVRDRASLGPQEEYSEELVLAAAAAAAAAADLD